MAIPNPDTKFPLALIAGPTASGKTALALHLAARHDAAIINADSAQVYSDLPILSAQPTQAEMQQAPHRLFSYLDGTTPCSAAKWAEDAKAEIARAHAAGQLPILVGGTGLYLRTLLDGIAPMAEIDPEIRQQVRDLPTEEAAAQLRQADPAMADRLNPADSSRIKRALEVILSTGRSILDWRTEKTGGIGDRVDLTAILLLPPRDWLYERCDRRFEMMMEMGAEEEVRKLLARDLPDDAPVMRAIGVPEIAAMIRGEISREEAVIRASIATRQYAKRQYTWFRNQTPPDWNRYDQCPDKAELVKFETLFQ